MIIGTVQNLDSELDCGLDSGFNNGLNFDCQGSKVKCMLISSKVLSIIICQP